MELPKEVIQYAQKVTANTARLIAEDMHKEAQFVIETFYNDYTPKYYQRNYVNFQRNSFKKYYNNRNNKVYSGGIELTPELMKDYYNYPASWVHEAVFYGFHGLPIEGTPRMSPNPLQLLLRKQDKIKSNIDKYINKAQKIVG